MNDMNVALTASADKSVGALAQHARIVLQLF